MSEYPNVAFEYVPDPENYLHCEVCGCIVEAEDNGLCVCCAEMAADMKWGIYEPI
jgi:hypothetical protein